MKECLDCWIAGLLDGWNDGWNDGWTVFSEESWLEARPGGKATMTKKNQQGPTCFFPNQQLIWLMLACNTQQNVETVSCLHCDMGLCFHT